MEPVSWVTAVSAIYLDGNALAPSGWTVSGNTVTFSLGAVSADGKRFLAVVPQAFAGEQPLTVILNWSAEVRQ